MRKVILPVLLLLLSGSAFAQDGYKKVIVKVINAGKAALPGASVYLLSTDSVVVQSGAADNAGNIQFSNLKPLIYRVRATQLGYTEGWSEAIDLRGPGAITVTVSLIPQSTSLDNVTVVSKKAAVQFLADKTVINPEASISNAGATVMDVLEKSPGITVAKDGSIIMKGKPSVNVLIDGKPTQLSGADLQAYLSGMSASQVEAIELIENPGAKYDAAGNAGIINIKTKSIRQRGFNGSLNLSVGQGFYPKTGNSANFNYRNGKFNWFLNYGFRASNEKQNIYTLRKYFDVNMEDSVLLEQPNFSKNWNTSHNVKTGFDFFLSNRTTLGIAYTLGRFKRNTSSYSAIEWMDPDFNIDSTINTVGENNLQFKRDGITLNGRHKIDETSELNADFDYVQFAIDGDQNYQTQLVAPGADVNATKGTIPSRLKIFTAKVDYSKHFKTVLLEAGIKTAINKTDNLADYYYLNNNYWMPDLSRSNHFLYNEKISAGYASLDAERGKWHWQLGLRYELTSYKAHQLGNAVIADSSFSRNYGSLFPTAFASLDADSNNVFTFRFGRRIDRPPFQFLNPFLTTLNKYTYEAGNPFIRPQYTWNFSVAHTYKQMLTTELSYSYLKDYFSQIFVIDSNTSNVNKNIIIYTRGNVGSFQNFGISETFQKSLTSWWNMTAVAVLNHKIIKGVVWAPIRADVTQLMVSINNQFQLKHGWGFEISGYYQTKSQIDLQEWLKPQGELDLGVSKQIMKNRGSLKLSVRDLTAFQNYSGYSTFQNAYEPFRVTWDSRVVRLSFNWRFGKAMKPISHSEGGAEEEINRAKAAD